MASVDELSEQLAGGARLSRRERMESSVDLSTEARSLTGYKDTLRKQYPPLEPFEHTYLRMEPGKAGAQPASADEAEASQRNSGTHYVYVEQCGARNGHPVVFLHGGPGGGATTDDRRWFDPAHYRIVLLDQRGSGRSRPHADLAHNTTWDLVEDLERIRTHLRIEKWHVFGGSWGSTLSLAYAQAHPDRVSALILRGIFTLRKSELNFFYGSDGGASHLFPDQFERYVEFIPPEERGDMIRAYYARLTGREANVQREAANRWSTWENATSKLYVDREAIAHGDDVEWALAFARIESHYFAHGGWFPDGSLLTKENVDKIRHIPTTIVQGRYDIVCPCTTAYALHREWPEAKFVLVPDAGHSAKEPGIMHHLIQSTDEYRHSTS